MVHKIYFYDSHVGTAKFLEFAYPLEDEINFSETLLDYKNSLSVILKEYRYFFTCPSDCGDEPYSNLIVDCNDKILEDVVKFSEVFFRFRGFVC